jgi:hypothetical protein
MNRRSKSFLIGSILSIFFYAQSAFAQGQTTGSGGQTTSGGCPAGTICNPITATSLNGLLLDILQGVIKIGIPVIALAIIYAGFLLVTARGNEEQLKKGKNTLWYTVIGAAILLGSWAIALLIQQTITSLSSYKLR